MGAVMEALSPGSTWMFYRPKTGPLVVRAGHFVPKLSSLGPSDSVWLVPTWVPPTPEPEE
jgi:hypothetical protein